MGYYYYINYIKVIPIKNCQGTTITEAWKQLQHYFKQAGIPLNTYVLDNEQSKDLHKAFQDKNIKHQLILPYKDKNNQTERELKYAISS